MLKHGWELTYVYATDGRHGSDTVPPEELVEIRREEARKARRLLGVRDCLELGVEDGSTAGLRSPELKALKQQLASILTGTRADVAMVPSRSDMHPDHRATHDLVSGVIQDLGLTPLLVKYFVWLFPEFYRKVPDVVERILMVGIDREMTDKLAAIRLHQSQISRGSFDTMVESLNTYLACAFRASTALGARYVEIIGLNGVEQNGPAMQALLKALEPCADITSVLHGRPSQEIGA
jgi:LmbE family N-acetylglucosaminyl deacetylase